MAEPDPPPPRQATPSLPVLDVAGPIRAAARDRGTLVLVAPPGTGKTTAVPPLLCDEPWTRGGRILVVEPRRIAARMAATRMADNAGVPVGGRFGYTVRGDRAVSGATAVHAVTTGVLLRMLQDDPSLPGVAAVLLDEFHERSVDSDLALAFLLDVRRGLRPDLRLAVMSATIDPAPVAELLRDGSGAAPVVEAVAPLFPVRTVHRPGSAHDPLESRVAEVVVEALRAGDGDVLVFLPGRPEIRRTGRELSGRLGRNTVAVELHGSLSASQQAAVVAPPVGGPRRVILSTSLAETSVTVPGVRIVVDGGRRRTVRVDPRRAVPRLTTGPVSRAGADQRRGRAGREAPGVAYRLWSAEDERHLPEADRPEIVDGDLADLVLQVSCWGAGSTDELDWLDPPPPTAVDTARGLLRVLGALDATGRPTERGRRMAQLGTHPRVAALLLADGGPTDVAVALAALLDASGSREVSAVDAVVELRAGRGPDGVAAAARQWRRLLGDAVARPSGDVATEALGREVGDRLLAGFPDRVALRRRAGRTDDRGRALTVFQLRSGAEAAVPGGHDGPGGLAGSDWIVVADLDGGDGGPGRVHLAAPVTRDQVLTTLSGSVEDAAEVIWDDDRDEVVARRVRRLGAIVVEESPWRDPTPSVARDAVVAALRRRGPELLAGWASTEELRGRVAWLRANEPDGGWPDLSWAALCDRLEEWLAPVLPAVARRRDLDRIDVRHALEGLLGWELRRRLDEAAPTRLPTTSGRSVALHYGALDGEDASVVASLRPQDLYGTDEHPTVGPDVPVVVELLSPARRPIQRTSDLPGFWRTGWPAVRAEMRGRYPKHDWPERPWESR